MIGERNAGESSIGSSPPVDQIAGGEQPPEDHVDFVTWDEYQDFEDYSGFASGGNPDLWLYRDRTTALLWRYMRLAVEMGRLPSLLGREFFRARVSPYSVQTFKDTVIFVHDVESCVLSLDAADKILIAMLGMEQYTQEEAALSLRCTQRTIGRRYVDALDNLSEIFLKREILRALPEKSTNLMEACQEGKTPELSVSDSEQRENNRDCAFHTGEASMINLLWRCQLWSDTNTGPTYGGPFSNTSGTNAIARGGQR